MPVVYRIIKTRYAENTFDGYGAKKYGGRWNSKGVAVTYTSDTVSLAALEVLVHLHNPAILEAYTLCALEIPDDEVLVLAEEALPDDWRLDPAPLSTAGIGDDWVAGGDSLALAVPSTIIPMQNNILLNPGHAAFAEVVKTVRCEPFTFDQRLLAAKAGT